MSFSPVCALIRVSYRNRIAKDSAHFGLFFLDLLEFLTNAEQKKKRENQGTSIIRRENSTKNSGPFFR